MATTPTRKQPILKMQHQSACDNALVPFTVTNEPYLLFSDLEDVARVSVSTKVAATIDGSLLENNLNETSSPNSKEKFLQIAGNLCLCLFFS